MGPTEELRRPLDSKNPQGLLRIYEQPLEGSIAIYRGCLLSRYICALLPHTEIQKADVCTHPILVDRRGHSYQDQIHPRVHYYPCIVLLNIDSIAFE